MKKTIQAIHDWWTDPSDIRIPRQYRHLVGSEHPTLARDRRAADELRESPVGSSQPEEAH